MTRTITCLITIALALAPAAASCNIPVRIPPYLSNSTSSQPWAAPPPEHYSGTWYFANVSIPAYKALPNLQWDVWLSTPTCLANSTDLCPPSTLAGEMIEITTWAINDTSSPFYFGARGGGDRPCASFLGHHTPRRLNSSGNWDDARWDGVFDINGYEGVMDGYKNQWSVLAWGADAKGVDFIIVHEDASTNKGRPDQNATLDVVSRSVRGVEPGSLAKVLGALEGLGNEVINKMIGELGPVKWNYTLAGGAAICPEGCLNNAKV